MDTQGKTMRDLALKDMFAKKQTFLVLSKESKIQCPRI